MARSLLLAVILAGAAIAGIWWATRDAEEAGPAPANREGLAREEAGASLEGRAGARADPATDSRAQPSTTPPHVSRQLKDAEARLRSAKAALEASVGRPEDVAAAERAVWLARLEAGTISKEEAYAHIVKLDEETLGITSALVKHGLRTPDEVLLARLRLQQSKRHAGDADERFLDARAECVQALKRLNAARIRQGKGSPLDLQRRLVDLYREFPAEPGGPDIELERAGAALRDILVSQMGGFPGEEQLRADDWRVARLLELWDVRGMIGDVAPRRVHVEKARIYEQLVRELETRTVGVVPPPELLPTTRVRLHREKLLLGEDDEDYASLRAALLRSERQRLDTLVASNLRSVEERDAALDHLNREFPPADELSAAAAD